MNESSWPIIDNKLSKIFRFDDFKQAFAFMTAVANICEEHHHHPDWSNSYNIVTITLCTHDAGNTLTDKDHNLAEAIDNCHLKK